VPKAEDSYAQGINSTGDVVYWWEDSAKGIHGALRQGGKYFTLDDPQGVGETYGYGLNDHSQIVGSYITSRILHGYEATY